MQNSPEDNSKIDLKPKNDGSVKTPLGCELPTLSREDHPPDSLSLNLASARSNDKEWDWICPDGTLSDSPGTSLKLMLLLTYFYVFKD